MFGFKLKRPGPIHVTFVDKLALKWAFPPSTAVSPCQYHSTTAPYSFFIYMLLLTEGQLGKAWERPKSYALSEIGENWDRKYFHFIWYLRD
jgi:hypothetical protein